ncbi:uncharacterized protein [Aegilops tauschii subsp. strangulata]|uniref:uncharacterized protein n=1 Tax=Aegilops tauschii subsp. strangulata TaxID=200361 RepID=UPI00098A3875|nr:uncharacterized protein LOC109734925 [Aegilops tauschii subsp. strangulata]
MATVTSSSPSCPKPKAAKPARYCLCAPTTHPGSFRCRLHRPTAAKAAPSSEPEAAKESVERKEAVAAAAARALLGRVARAPGRDAGRIKGFQPGPSRLRIMDRTVESVQTAEDVVSVSVT